jgi:hypothetical protein
MNADRLIPRMNENIEDEKIILGFRCIYARMALMIIFNTNDTKMFFLKPLLIFCILLTVPCILGVVTPFYNILPRKSLLLHQMQTEGKPV